MIDFLRGRERARGSERPKEGCIGGGVTAVAAVAAKNRTEMVLRPRSAGLRACGRSQKTNKAVKQDHDDRVTAQAISTRNSSSDTAVNSSQSKTRGPRS